MAKQMGFVLAAAIALTLVLSGCGTSGSSMNGGGNTANSTNTQGVTANSITVGAWSPLSGPAAAYSEITDGAQAYFNFLNAKGGIAGHQVKYVVLDDQLDPSKTVGVARQLIDNNHVFAIVGGVGSTTGAAAMDFVNQNQVPVIPSAGAPKWSSPFKQNWYAAYPSYVGEATLQAHYAVNDLKAKKVAVLYENDDIGIPGKNAVLKELSSLGVTPTATVAYDKSNSQFSPTILALKNSGANVVISWSLVAQTASILKTAQQLGYHPQWVLSSFNVDPTLLSLAGSAANGAIVADYLPLASQDNSKIQDYWTEMTKDYPNVKPGMLSEQGWEFAEIFAKGAQDAFTQYGGLTRSNFEKALDNLSNYSTDLIYKLSYSPTDHSGPKYEFFVKVENGNFVQSSNYQEIPK